MSTPAQYDVRIGALEGEAADAGVGMAPKLRCAAQLAGQGGSKVWAQGAGHIGIHLCQMKDG